MDLQHLRDRNLWIGIWGRIQTSATSINWRRLKRVDILTLIFTIISTVIVAYGLILDLSRDRSALESTYPSLDFGVSRIGVDGYISSITVTNPNNRRLKLVGLNIIKPSGFVAVLPNTKTGDLFDFAFPGRVSYGPNALQHLMPGADLAARETRLLRFLVARRDWQGETRQGGVEISAEQAEALQIELSWRLEQEGAESITKILTPHGALHDEETSD